MHFGNLRVMTSFSSITYSTHFAGVRRYTQWNSSWEIYWKNDWAVRISWFPVEWESDRYVPLEYPHISSRTLKKIHKYLRVEISFWLKIQKTWHVYTYVYTGGKLIDEVLLNLLQDKLSRAIIWFENIDYSHSDYSCVLNNCIMYGIETTNLWQ